jgi:hypothetical protein
VIVGVQATAARFDAELKTYVAVDDSGVTRLNADGTPMRGEALYQEFSNAKPWLVGRSNGGWYRRIGLQRERRASIS